MNLFERILNLFGWNLSSCDFDDQKLIIIGAPHTSNWDFPLTLLALWAMKIKLSWVAKHTLFRQPIGSIFKALGGIPVNRKVRHGFIHQIHSLFAENDTIYLAIAPEGTRSKVDHWKTGFYQIALGANVNIGLGFVDYEKKIIGIGRIFKPTGDIESDFAEIRGFYQDKIGKYPELQSDIRVRAKEVTFFKKKFQKE